MELKIIARVKSDFPEKFGIPRQSGLAQVKGRIIFEPEYRVKEAVRGLEGYSHIWLLWQFSEAVREDWSPTVRPPKLGGNKRMGVFATRSPFRPNPIGLSAVRLEKIDLDCPFAPVLHIVGADIMDNTPLYDIKPYLPYADAYPEASGGFALQDRVGLKVVCEDKLLFKLPEEKREGLVSLLAQDPRPAYQEDPQRIYTMSYSDFQVSFKGEGDIIEVTDIRENEK